MPSLSQNIREVPYSEIRDSISASSPDLTELLDEISPDKKLPLIKISYPFGSLILDKTILHLPTSGYQSIPITDPDVPNKIKEDLGYSNLPLGCITNNNGVEIYRKTSGKIHSATFFNNTDLTLGLWETFSPPTPFSITAGARTLMLLPKISDSSSHANLKSIGAKSPAPYLPFEQWQIFRELASNPSFPTPWNCEIVFFTKKWSDIINSPEGLKLKHHLLKKVWKQTEYNRFRFLYDETWESFFNILSSRKIKPISYIIGLFRHLIILATGSETTVAYEPFNGKNIAGPIDEFLKIYLEVYKLKNYSPTMMLPCHFLGNASKKPVYYPIQIPTYPDSSPKFRDSISAKKDLEYLAWLLDTFQNELKSGNIRVSIPEIKDIFDKVSFDFFHTDGKINQEIKPSSLMPTEDERLIYCPGDYGDRKFAQRSSFARSCVRISPK